MALTYTGKLFRRIAICCGAWTGNPHYLWESTLQSKFSDEYLSNLEFLWSRGKDGKWHSKMWPADDREYEFWKALRWLNESGYITLHETRNAHYYKTHVTFTFPDTKIKLTEKGLAAAPAYMKIKEE